MLAIRFELVGRRRFDETPDSGESRRRFVSGDFGEFTVNGEYSLYM